MIDTAALKNRILALALTGQVANNKKDVKQLFESLCDNAYKIDKNKVSDKNYDLSELPFEIPDNWKWVCIGDIFQHNTGKALNSSNTEGTSLEYITTSNLYWDRFELENLKTMLFKDSEIEKCTVRKGDLLICEGGDIGRSAIWSEDYEMRIQNHIHRLRPYIDDICARFYYYVMMYYKNNGLISGRGIGLQGLSSKRLHSILVPLPDIETQYVIAEKIDESFSVIDTIDELQSQYSSDIEVLKSKIIDVGIQGKLTEQLPEDGTAEELLEQIVVERMQLVKQKKIKKGRQLPEITEDDKSINIPDSWTWVRLGDISQIFGGKRIPAGRSLTTENTGYKYIRVSEMKNRTVLTDNLMYVPEDIYPSISRYIINKEDIYITVAGTIGRVGTIPDEIDGANLTENADRVVFSNLNKDWLVTCLDSSFVQKQIAMVTTQVAQPKLAIKRIEELIIPLPPLAEQERIAAKVVETLALL